ncbi:unnamed protein product [Arctia plantaginis]|uniref:Peptidase S1 domain-containing protein n=1 Tax=Arctia plantaginis TaxID=874455 RepID=A0A8S1A8U6_ARCPL|nr:unnamed protein product [Arctia plantaginis]
MRLLSILAVCVTAVAAAPSSDLSPRIVGGTAFPIQQWPQIANVLFTWDTATFGQYCGGTIISNRFILTAAHCINFHPANRFRVRVGSVLASSGGVAHAVDGVIPHPFYNPQTEDLDIGLIRTINNLTFTAQVQAARFAGSDYTLGDNELVQAPGWGAERTGGPRSEQLHVVQIWTINQRVPKGSVWSKNPPYSF